MRLLLVFLLFFAGAESLLALPRVTFPSAPFVRNNEFVPVQFEFDKPDQKFTVIGDMKIVYRFKASQGVYRTSLHYKSTSQGFRVHVEGKDYDFRWPKELIARSNHEFLIGVDAGLELPEATPKGLRFSRVRKLEDWKPEDLTIFDALVYKREAGFLAKREGLNRLGIGAFHQVTNDQEKAFAPSFLAGYAGFKDWQALPALVKQARFANVPGSLPHFALKAISDPLPPSSFKGIWPRPAGDTWLKVLGLGILGLVLLALAYFLRLERRKKARLKALVGVSIGGIGLLIGMLYLVDQRGEDALNQARKAPLAGISAYALTIKDATTLSLYDSALDARLFGPDSRRKITIPASTKVFAKGKPYGNGLVVDFWASERDATILLPKGFAFGVYHFHDLADDLEPSWHARVVDDAGRLQQLPSDGAGDHSINDFPGAFVPEDRRIRKITELWLKELFVNGRRWSIGRGPIPAEDHEFDFSGDFPKERQVVFSFTENSNPFDKLSDPR